MEEKIVKVREVDGITVIRVIEKKLYQNVVGHFQEKIVSLVDSGKRHLIVDLSAVDVMNSSGLGVLILTWDRLSKEGGDLIIVGLGSLLKELFQRMRLDLIFTLAETEQEAFDLIRGDKKIPAD